MNPKINGKAVLDKLKSQNKVERTKVSLYLTKDLYQQFKGVCEKGGVPSSTVIEELMKQFLDSFEKAK